MLRRTIKGYFMLFRILPVLVWSFTGSLVGTSIALLDNYEMNWIAFGLVMAISALIQGYPTHIVNEIFDWKSGADSHELRTKKSGGSKVLQARLLSIKDLWGVFAFSNVAIGLLIFACWRAVDLGIILYFIIPGYLSGLLYSLPPFRFCYRPFLGEWLGGFAGMFLLVLGSFYAQTLVVTQFAIFVAFGLGLIYIAIMTFFHYLDFGHDKLATPKKNTTVVYLGLIRSRQYAYLCLGLAVLVFSLSTFLFQTQVMPLFLLSLAVLLGHQRANLYNALSIIKWGKVITYSTILAGLTVAALAKPLMLLMILPVILSFWAHKKFGKLNHLPLEISS